MKSHALPIMLSWLGLIASAPNAHAALRGQNPDNASIDLTDIHDTKDHGFTISPYLGVGTLSFKGNALATGKAADSNGLWIGANLAYRSRHHLVTEVGYSLYMDDAIHPFRNDNLYSNEEVKFAFGYEFNPAPGVRLTPTTGITYWSLESPDGRLAPNGLRRRSGYNGYWEVSLVKEINHRVALGAIAKSNHYGFGNQRSIGFITTISL